MHRHWTDAAVAEAITYSALRPVLENRVTFAACRTVSMFVREHGLEALTDRWLLAAPGFTAVTSKPSDVVMRETVTVLPLAGIPVRALSVFHESDTP
jgi:hypothetical protein